MPSIQANFDNVLRFGGAAIVVIGIFLVLQPFLSGLVFAGVLGIATWPLFERLKKSVGGNATLAATVMLMMILVLVIIPITLLSVAAADKLPAAVDLIKGWTRAACTPPSCSGRSRCSAIGPSANWNRC